MDGFYFSYITAKVLRIFASNLLGITKVRRILYSYSTVVVVGNEKKTVCGRRLDFTRKEREM